jgi:PAS domain S-box-containing protein
MLGYEEGEIGKDFSAWEKLFHPNDKARALEEIQSYLNGQKLTFESEYRLRHKDGSYRWILARAVASRGSQGTPIRMAGSHIDLTERKQAEERLTAAYRELEANEEELKRTLEEL